MCRHNKQKHLFKYPGVVFLLLLLSFSSFAQGLKVAAAANLQGVIKVLQKDFQQRAGITIEPIISSSGNLVAQIKNGAPFDIFLSADMKFPQSLFKDGFTTKEPVVYALGSLIICSTQNIGFDNWERVLLTERVKKIAIANPAIAPYGKAAEEALMLKGIIGDVKPKVVYGESIAQVNTYITTGVVDVGFTTQALIKDAGDKVQLYYKIIDPQSYAPIQQGMVVIKQSKNIDQAEKFYQYMLSAPAKAILKEYGYHVE